MKSPSLSFTETLSLNEFDYSLFTDYTPPSVYACLLHLKSCDEALCNLFWSVMAPQRCREPRDHGFLGLIRIVDLAFCDDIYSLYLAETNQFKIWTINLWTVVRMAWKGRSDKKSTPASTAVNPSSKSKYQPSRLITNILFDLMDKVTNRKPIMTRPFGTIKRNDRDIKAANSSTSFIVAVIKVLQVVAPRLIIPMIGNLVHFLVPWYPGHYWLDSDCLHPAQPLWPRELTLFFCIEAVRERNWQENNDAILDFVQSVHLCNLWHNSSPLIIKGNSSACKLIIIHFKALTILFVQLDYSFRTFKRNKKIWN